MQRAVRAMRVVAHDVLPKRLRQVAWSGDPQVVEAFAAQRPDDALGHRVRARCADGGAENADVGAGEHGVEGGGELGIAVPDQESELFGAAPRSISRLRACWVTQAPVGWAVIPASCTRRRSCSITSRM
jgi:hypothetical protein